MPTNENIYAFSEILLDKEEEDIFMLEDKQWDRLIDEIADSFDRGVDLFSTRNVSECAQYEYEKCKKICRALRIAVLLACAVIIYFHLWR